MWESCCNNHCEINFAAELAKEAPSKGSLESDFDAFLNSFHGIRCPYFRITKIENGHESAQFANCEIDDCNWRVLLLSCGLGGCQVKEIVVRHCVVKPHHLLELSQTLEKMGPLTTLKLEYIVMTGEDFKAPLQSLLSLGNSIEYLSLRGSTLDESTWHSIFHALASNVSIRAINFSYCALTDEIVSRGINSGLHLNTILELINLSYNALTGTFLHDFEGLLFGKTFTAEDDAFVKNVAKLVGDRVKVIKDANKKRKKGGYNDLPEITYQNPQMVKVEADNKAFSTALNYLDLSGCPLSTPVVDEAFIAWRNKLAHSPEPILKSFHDAVHEGKKRFTILTKNCPLDYIDSNIHDSIAVLN